MQVKKLKVLNQNVCCGYSKMSVMQWVKSFISETVFHKNEYKRFIFIFFFVKYNISFFFSVFIHVTFDFMSNYLLKCPSINNLLKLHVYWELELNFNIA